MTAHTTSLSHKFPLVTNERLSKALTEWFNEELTFTHWEYIRESKKGESYIGEVISIKIHGVKNNSEPVYIQVVLKTIPRNVSRKLTLRTNEFFENEINFYKKVLPVFLAFQSQRKLKDPFNNHANLIFAESDGNNDVVCLEDATIDGFKCAVRQEGIDLEHCKLSLKTFAKFHAISFAMKDQEPEEFDKIRNIVQELYFTEHLWKWYARVWNKISEIAIDAVEKEYPNSIYLDKVKKFAVPQRYQDMIDAVTKTAKTGVICHGDSWSCNILYKYVQGHPIDAKLIDFQMTRLGSPVLDISIYIYSCTTQELRDKHYDDLLQFYYETLANQIKELGSDPRQIYPWDLFMAEIKKYSYFGLGFSFETTPFSVLSPEDAFDMEIQGNQKVDLADMWKFEKFKTKKDRLREANNVKHCVDRGFI